MSVSLNVKAYASKDSKEFQKHYKAVQFCIENQLSFPKETSEFFKGKCNGENLEDIREDAILEYLENGVEIELPLHISPDKVCIKVSEIPAEVDTIIVQLT